MQRSAKVVVIFSAAVAAALSGMPQAWAANAVGWTGAANPELCIVDAQWGTSMTGYVCDFGAPGGYVQGAYRVQVNQASSVYVQATAGSIPDGYYQPQTQSIWYTIPGGSIRQYNTNYYGCSNGAARGQLNYGGATPGNTTPSHSCSQPF